MQKTRGRALNGSLLPVTFQEIAAYADLAGYRSLDERHTLMQFVRHMDYEFLHFWKLNAHGG